MDFAQTIEPYRKQIDEQLAEYFARKHTDLKEANSDIAEENYLAMQNYILGKGKRLRSVCAILSYTACGGVEREKMILPSLSVEFFHNASLILDDVMDEDKERREIIAAHELVGKWFKEKFKQKKYKGYLFADEQSRFAVSMSMIATDMLFSLGSQTILDSKFDAEKVVKALHAYEKTYRLVNLGQMLDVYYEHEKNITKEQYLRMAYLKTGALLGGALKIGGILAGATEQRLRAMDEFAKYSATTFQIQDDILDVTKGAEKGRELGSDLKKGKTTILVIVAKEMLSKEKWKHVERVLGNEKATKSDLDAAMQVLHKEGVVAATQRLAEKYNAQGKAAIRHAKPAFPQEYLKMFDAFADYLMHRKK